MRDPQERLRDVLEGGSVVLDDVTPQGLAFLVRDTERRHRVTPVTLADDVSIQFRGTLAAQAGFVDLGERDAPQAFGRPRPDTSVFHDFRHRPFLARYRRGRIPISSSPPARPHRG